MLARHRGLLTRSGILVLALLLAAGPGWSLSAAQETHSVEAGEQPDAASGGARTFDLFDAEELIAACTAMATESAENRAADKERRRKTAYVKCLREAILDQCSGVIASHLSFAERDGADMGEKRSYWEGRAEWIADQTRSCIPSCRPIEQVRSMLDHAVKVGEAVLRDPGCRAQRLRWRRERLFTVGRCRGVVEDVLEHLRSHAPPARRCRSPRVRRGSPRCAAW